MPTFLQGHREAGDRGLQLAAEQVRVDVGGSGVGVAEKPLDRRPACAAAVEQGGEGVAEDVPSDGTNTNPPARSTERLVGRGAAVRVPVHSSEDESLRPGTSRKQRANLGRQRNPTNAVALGRGQLAQGERLSHGQGRCSLVQGHVLPVQGEDLANPHAGVNRDQDGVAPARLGPVGHEPAYVVRAQRQFLRRTGNLRPRDDRRGGKHLPPHGTRQVRADRAQVQVDGLRRETCAPFLGAVLLDEVSVDVLEPPRAKPGQ